MYKTSSFYIAENTAHLHYKNRAVIVICGRSRQLFQELYKTYKYTLWAECSFLLLKQVVYIFATELQRVKYDGVCWSLNYHQ